MVSLRRADAIALALVGVATLASVALWSELPARLAIHFGPSGTPDSFVAKPIGVFGMFVLAVVSIAYARVRPFDSSPTSPAAEDAAVLFLGVVLAYVQGIILAWNLGYRFDIAVAVLPLLVGGGLLVAFTLWRRG